jgi:hypothetical protein
MPDMDQQPDHRRSPCDAVFRVAEFRVESVWEQKVRKIFAVGEKFALL